MVWVVLAWLYMGLLFLVLGALVTGALSRLDGTGRWQPNAFFVPWFGMCVVSLVTTTWSLLGPVGPACHLALLLMAVVGLGLDAVRSELQRCFRGLTSIPSVAWALIAWLALNLAFAGTDGPVYNLDSGRYHFQNLLWAKTYGAVPGLANLHARYGFSSSWYLVHAVVDWGPLASRSYHVVNSLLVLLVLSAGIVQTFRCVSAAPSVLAAAMIASLGFLGWYYDLFRYLFLSTLTPDLPVNVFVIVSLLLAIDVMSHGAGPSRSGLFALAVLASQTFAVRPSGAYVGALVLAVVWAAWRRVGRATVVAALALGLLLALPSLLRSYVVSGWPLFPSTALGFLSPDWQYPRAETVKAMEEDIQRFAYLAHLMSDKAPAPRPQIPLGQAFLLWLRHQLVSGGFLYWLVAGSLLTVGCWRLKNRLVSLAIASQLATALWLTTSPHFRYGWGYLAIAFVAPAAVLLAGRPDAFRRLRSVAAGALLAAVVVNITLKTSGVSARQSGLLYPVRVLEAYAAQAFRPLLRLPKAPYVVVTLQGRPFHLVQWDGSYVGWGRFHQPPLPLLPGPMLDSDSRLLPGFAPGYNASVATLVWETPLPAWPAIVPGLEFRGSTLEEGFRLGTAVRVRTESR